jgi:hypothetical protein
MLFFFANGLQRYVLLSKPANFSRHFFSAGAFPKSGTKIKGCQISPSIVTKLFLPQGGKKYLCAIEVNQLWGGLVHFLEKNRPGNLGIPAVYCYFYTNPFAALHRQPKVV